MNQPIRIYLRLKDEFAPTVINSAEIASKMRHEITEKLKADTGADTVFYSKGIRNVRLSLGFKEKRENPEFKVKVERLEGYYVYSPRVRTQTGKLIAKAESDINKYPSITQFVCKKYGIPTESFIGLSLCRTVFGRPNNVVIGVIHGQSGDIPKIPDEFEEITATQFDSLNKVKDKEAA